MNEATQTIAPAAQRKKELRALIAEELAKFERPMLYAYYIDYRRCDDGVVRSFGYTHKENIGYDASQTQEAFDAYFRKSRRFKEHSIEFVIKDGRFGGKQHKVLKAGMFWINYEEPAKK